MVGLDDLKIINPADLREAPETRITYERISLFRINELCSRRRVNMLNHDLLNLLA